MEEQFSSKKLIEGENKEAAENSELVQQE